MKRDSRKLAAAAGLSWAVGYVICAFFVAVAPVRTMAAFGYVMHYDFGNVTRPLTWASFCVGLVVTSAVVALLVGLGAWFYRRLSAGNGELNAV
jgi:FtsH-binding integral membrane protein